MSTGDERRWANSRFKSKTSRSVRDIFSPLSHAPVRTMNQSFLYRHTMKTSRTKRMPRRFYFRDTFQNLVLCVL
jgi:hypothetical protein